MIVGAWIRAREHRGRYMVIYLPTFKTYRTDAPGTPRVVLKRR